MSNNTTERDACWTETINKSNKGLMGPAHASSGAGFALLFLGGLSALSYYHKIEIPFGLDLTVIIIAFVSACAGAVMIPDLDNSQAKIITIMGVTGKPLSYLFRGTSTAIQTVVRSPLDDSHPNPHRGFWHSIVGALVLGGIVFGLSSIKHEIPLWVIGEVPVGTIIAFVVVVILTNIMNSSLPNSPENFLFKKAKSFELFSVLFSFVFTAIVFAFLPDINFLWLGIAVSLGMIIHILGDALTVKGVPILFPIAVFLHGKMWWMTRFAKFNASDPTLNKVVIVISTVAGVAGGLLFFLPHVMSYL